MVRVVEKVYREDVDEGGAYVAIAPRPVDPEQHSDLRAIAGFFREAGAELYAVGHSGGYEPVEDAISQKPCPPGLRG